MSLQRQINLPAVIETQSIPVHQPEKEFNISDMFSLFVRRRTIIFSVAACFLAAGIIYCAVATRRYEATAEVQFQKESSGGSGLDSMTSQDDNSSVDAMEENISIETQSSILQSDSLALKVIKELDLEKNEDFKPRFSPVNWVMGFLTPEGVADPANAPLEESPHRRDRLLLVFGKRLKVKPVAGTRLIDISYSNPDPKVAAQVVNHMAQGLADYNFQTKHDSTAKTADWLASQMADLRAQSEKLQEKVARSQRDSGVLTLGGVDAQGREQLYSTVLDKLQQATTAYTQAQSNRIAREATYKVVQGGNPEAIAGLSGSALPSGTSDGALTLIQSLRMTQSDVQAKIAEASAKFGPAYPKLAELQGQLSAITSSIDSELKRLTDRAKNDYEVAQQVENNSRQVYLDQKRQADALNDKTIEYTILRQEADESRTLYETLFKQLKQAGVLADFRSNNITVVDPGRIPSLPATPKIPMTLLASLAAGLFFGGCAALLRDATDAKIQNLPDIEATLGQAPLAILPFHKTENSSSTRKAIGRRTVHRRAVVAPPPFVLPESQYPDGDTDLGFVQTLATLRNIAAFTQPNSPYVESLRSLRTSLMLSRGGAPPQVLLVASSVAGEGKSMLSVNLAAVLAQQGKRVLLVDADLRRPTLHRALKINGSEGLSAFLAGTGALKDPLQILVPTKEVPGLFVLPAGQIPPYPVELLGSDQMRIALAAWRDAFDFIVMDGCPILPIADSVVLSAIVDFTLLVARYKSTERQSLERSFNLLRPQIGSQRIGVVLNAVLRTGRSYYQYYGYQSSPYYSEAK